MSLQRGKEIQKKLTPNDFVEREGDPKELKQNNFIWSEGDTKAFKTE